MQSERAKQCTNEIDIYRQGYFYSIMSLSDLLVVALILIITLLALFIFIKLLPLLILAALMLFVIWFLYYRRGPRRSIAY